MWESLLEVGLGVKVNLRFWSNVVGILWGNRED